MVNNLCYKARSYALRISRPPSLSHAPECSWWEYADFNLLYGTAVHNLFFSELFSAASPFVIQAFPRTRLLLNPLSRDGK